MNTLLGLSAFFSLGMTFPFSIQLGRVKASMCFLCSIMQWKSLFHIHWAHRCQCLASVSLRHQGQFALLSSYPLLILDNSFYFLTHFMYTYWEHQLHDYKPSICLYPTLFARCDLEINDSSTHKSDRLRISHRILNYAYIHIMIKASFFIIKFTKYCFLL